MNVIINHSTTLGCEGKRGTDWELEMEYKGWEQFSLMKHFVMMRYFS
jgi:hypothetical protein